MTKYADAAEKLHSYGSYLVQCLPKYIQQFSVLKDELTLYVPPAGVVPVLTFLRDHSQCQYKACMDVSGADYPERDKRFEVVYHLLSVKYGGRIRVKTYAGEADAVPSAVGVFRGADWCVCISWAVPLRFFVCGCPHQLTGSVAQVRARGLGPVRRFLRGPPRPVRVVPNCDHM